MLREEYQCLHELLSDGKQYQESLKQKLKTLSGKQLIPIDKKKGGTSNEYTQHIFVVKSVHLDLELLSETFSYFQFVDCCCADF